MPAVTRTQYINASGAQTFNIVILGNFVGTQTILNDDRYVTYVGNGDSVPTVALPAAPFTGEIHYIGGDSDIGGFGMTISGNGKLISGASTYALAPSRKKVGLFYDGTEWQFMAITIASVAEGGAPIARVTYGILAGVTATTVGSSTPLIIGSAYLDTSQLKPAGPTLTREVFFKCVLQTTNASNTANIDLIDPGNVLGGGVGAEVAGSLITTTNLTSTYFSQRVTALEVGIDGIFQARIWINPQAAGQQVICTMAKLDVEYH